MVEFLNTVMPNVMSKLPTFFESLRDTVIMVCWSGVFSLVLGIVFGVILVVCRRGGILQNAVVYQIVDKVINFFRSIPFIILLAGLIDFTRLIMGTAIGVRGAIVPLIFGTTPFYARQIESALSEVDKGLIEAAQSMGDSPLQIIWRVYLRESIPNIVRVTTITIVSLVGLTAMAGTVGAGGLGDFAIRYGYSRNQTDVTYFSVVTIVIIVYLIQGAGSLIVKKAKR
jgi:D-methionine transport system permease protein